MDPVIESKAHELHRLLDKKEELEGNLKQTKENIAMLQSEFVKAMKDAGIIKGQVEGVGEIRLGSRTFANIPEATRPEAFEALRKLGEGGLIKTVESIHAQTLVGFVNRLLDEGKEVPACIKYGFIEEVKIK